MPQAPTPLHSQVTTPPHRRPEACSLEKQSEGIRTQRPQIQSRTGMRHCMENRGIKWKLIEW